MSVQEGIMLPLFEWPSTVSGAGSAYNLVVANASDEIVLDQWVTNQQPECSAQGCRFAPDETLFIDGLVNGTYMWWLRAWQAGSYSEWSEPITFVVNVPAPTLPIMNVSPNQGRPTISWAADANSYWFNLTIAEAGAVLLDTWVSASQLGCRSGTCAFTPDLDLEPGAYDVYVRAWGPGGYSSNGSSEWAGPASFLISDIVPAIPGNLVVVSGLQLRWQGVSNATWYHVWVGPQGSNHPILDEWLLAADLGCEQPTLCQLPVGSMLGAGNYHWYVQSYGPGGLSSGGTLDGWAQGPQFSVGP